MSDPKPYTMNECPVWHGTVASVDLGRVRATVEALEQERVEYAAEAQRHDETKAALLEAQRERDALRAEVERLTKERDEQLEDSERIIAALVHERDALKSALKTVAVRQREACARAAQAEATGATKCEGGPEFIAAAVRATPPVTEGGE